MTEHHRLIRWQVIHAVLMMVFANQFVHHVLPSQYFEIGLVATLPFHVFGMYWILKHGVEPAAKWLASRRPTIEERVLDTDE